jgi:hypothetical protein
MEEQHTAETVAPMSFSDKLINIFAAPGELYENVRQTGKTTSNWLIPLIILIVLSIVLTQVMLTNPSLADQLGTTIRKGMEKSVAEGKMTQEQMDRAYEFARPGSVWFTMFSIGGSIVWTLAKLFGLGLVFWLVGKTAMGAKAPYMKVVEVVGLTFLISALEVIVTTIMLFALDSLYATPSLALVVLRDFDLTNKLHVVLSNINVFTIWILTVTGIGLAKLFQRDLAKVLVLVFALWILWIVISVLTGFGAGR